MRTQNTTKKFKGRIKYSRSRGNHCYYLTLLGRNGKELEFPRSWDGYEARVTISIVEVFKYCKCGMSFRGGSYKFCPFCGSELKRRSGVDKRVVE